jgi:hypothetical protein
VSKWKRGPGETTLTVVVPANASAIVFVPVGSGEEVVSDAAAVRVRVESGNVIYRVASGMYKFVVNRNKLS